MKIDGRAIALKIYENLKIRVNNLKVRGVIPHIGVILIGDDAASRSYVTQKEIWSKYIGTLFSLVNYPLHISEDEVLASITKLTSNSAVHGIIIQRPLPRHIDKVKLTNAVPAEK